MAVLRSALLVIACVAGLSAQPFVFYRGIFNAGSFAPAGLPNGSIARGSIFVIFGRNMGPAVGVQVSEFPLGTNLQGVEVKVCQDGECVNAIPLFVRQDQINAIMPSDAPLGPVSIQVSFNGEAGNFSPAEVVEHSVGVFAYNAQGFGPGIVQNFNAANDTPLNSLALSARPGQVVIVWATGLGAGLNPDNVPPQVGDLPVNVEIFVGGVQVTNKLYSGRSSQFAGVDQIIFELPAGAPTGCYVPVHVRTGGEMVSNAATIAIDAGAGPCEDVFTPAKQVLPEGGRIGLVYVSRNIRFDRETGQERRIVDDFLHATFREENGGSWFFNPNLSHAPLGACHVHTSRGALSAAEPLPGTVATARELDAGVPLTVEGPGGMDGTGVSGSTVQVYREILGADDPTDERFDLVLGDTGNATVRGPGGADVGPWEVVVENGPPLQWTNRQSLLDIDRNLGATVVWTPASAGDYVWIWGGNADAVSNATTMFSCLVPAAQGTFEIPPYVLRNLPVTHPDGERTLGWLSLTGLKESQVRTFEAEGLDAGFATSYVRVRQRVSYR